MMIGDMSVAPGRRGIGDWLTDLVGVVTNDVNAVRSTVGASPITSASLFPSASSGSAPTTSNTTGTASAPVSVPSAGPVMAKSNQPTPWGTYALYAGGALAAVWVVSKLVRR